MPKFEMKDVLFFDEVADDQIARVGGKGAHLAALSRIEGIRVPAGFCIATSAFDRIVKRAAIEDLHTSDEIRRAIEAVAIPDDLAAAVAQAVARLGEDGAYAVRSSATAEDLPTASFAGQQDSYLNIVGTPAILEHISKCWASLFTARAMTYRRRNGFDHRKVHMAVVVQRMVDANASGVLFTADPLSGDRKVCSIEAVFGLGEALVSGHVNPGIYKLRDDAIIERAAPLTDDQAVRLGRLGRVIEARFGRPQDIEWCLADDVFHIVQSRPITTLFPIPVRNDGENHVYLSVGHQQMMTDAMKPLGISFWQLIAAGPMHTAGGRMFVDATQALASPSGRAALLDLVRKSDPLMESALLSITERRDFLPAAAEAAPNAAARLAAIPLIDADPSLVTTLIARAEAALATLKNEIRGKTGVALLDFIRADIKETKRVLFDAESLQVVMAAMRATWWLNEHLETWLGEKNAADTLAQSVPHNVTSEMGLALLDVADALRSGGEPLVALEGWLEKYGMRCPGEIDITRPRFREQPSMLVPTLESNMKTFAPGEAARRFEHGEKQAAKKEHELLERLRALPDGDQKASEAKGMVDRIRTFMGYREYPKYGMVSRTFVYKQALLEEAERLVSEKALREKEDIYYLTFEELHDVVRTRTVDDALIGNRKAAFAEYCALTPPRVMTSDGEAVRGSYRRDDLPAGALVGLAVSAGIIEGRARVILDMAKADLEPGDILVTTFTDPSWTPLFVAVKGLVTEVGGLMTHGAVIAREYGLPAVVGVEDATKRIRDGQRIRVHGTEGYIELLA